MAKASPVKFRPFRMGAKFGSLTLGIETVSIGLKIQLESISEEGGEDFDRSLAVARAYRMLCARQIGAKIILGKRNDDDKQTKLIESDIELAATWMTGRLGAGSKDFSIKISVPKESVGAPGIAILTKFAGREGYFKITSLMDEIELDDETEE